MINLKQNHRPLREHLTAWNAKYPIDLIWRAKNNIQFGSPEHKSMDFLSMLFNLMQDYDIAEYRKEQEIANDDMDEFSQVYKDEKQQGKVVKMTKSEIDEAFDAIDLDELNKDLLNGNTKGNNI